MLEFLQLGKVPSWQIVASVTVVCIGVTAATITDPVSANNLVGVAVGAVSTFVTAEFGIQAGAMQRNHQLSSAQLLLAYTPWASVALFAFCLLLEPVGLWPNQGHWHGTTATILSYRYVPRLAGSLVSLKELMTCCNAGSLPCLP
jgi:solute carrier family 35 protein E3